MSVDDIYIVGWSQQDASYSHRHWEILRRSIHAVLCWIVIWLRSYSTPTDHLFGSRVSKELRLHVQFVRFIVLYNIVSVNTLLVVLLVSSALVVLTPQPPTFPFAVLDFCRLVWASLQTFPSVQVSYLQASGSGNLRCT